MSIIGGSFLAGLGQGLATIGSMGMKYQAELDELAAKREAKLEEIRLSRQLIAEEKGAERKAVSERRSRLMGAYGVDEEEAPLSDRRFSVAVEDESGGHSMQDEKAHKKYVEKRRRGLVEAEIASFKPEALDDVAKARRTGMFTDMMEGSDLEGRRQAAIAEKGGSRYEVKGDEKIDEFSGFGGQTDQGKSKIEENRAQATRASQGAGLDKIDKRLAAEDGRIRLIENTLARIETDRERAIAAAARTAIGPDDVAAKQDEAAARFDTQNKERVDRLRKELQQATESRARIAEAFDAKQKLPEGKPAAKSAPYAEGTRLRGKDGKVYVVKGGRPVLAN